MPEDVQQGYEFLWCGHKGKVLSKSWEAEVPEVGPYDPGKPFPSVRKRLVWVELQMGPGKPIQVILAVNEVLDTA